MPLRFFSLLLVLLLLLLSRTPCQAQRVRGLLMTSDNKPAAYAVVKLYGSDSALIKYELCGPDGSYGFEDLPGKGLYRISFSLVGYMALDTSLLVGSDVSITNTMMPAIKNLRAAVVTNEKPMFERKIDRFVFNVQNSMAASSGDAMDVLRLTPLVDMQNDALSIVGKGSVSVMVNDRMLRISGEDLYNYLRSIPSGSIESIEVITMPPAKYSAEGNSGIINIKLKKVVNDHWSAALRSIYTQTTYPAINPGFNFDYQRNRFSLSTSGGSTEGSSEFTERPDIFYPDQTWNGASTSRHYTNLYNVRVLSDYKVSNKLTIGVQGFYNQSRPHYTDQSLNLITDNVSKQADSSLTGNGQQHAFNENISLNLHSIYTLGADNQKIAFDFDYYGSSNNTDRPFGSAAYDADNSLIPGSEWFSHNIGNNSFHNYSFNLVANHKIRHLDVEYGLNYTDSRNLSELQATIVQRNTDTLFHYDDLFHFDEKTESAFLTVDRKIGKKHEVELGLRGENTNTRGISNTLEKEYRNQYFELFPNVYYEYDMNDKNSFSISYGRRIDRPNYLGLNPFERYISQFYYSVGNPYLLPSFTNNFELDYSNNNNFTAQAFTNAGNNQIAQTAIPNAVTKVVVDTMQNFYNSLNVGVTATYAVKKLKWLESNFVVTGYYRRITEQNPALVPNSEEWSYYLSTTNTFKINAKLTSQLTFYYNSPQLTGIYRRTARYNLSGSIRYRVNKKFELALAANDVLKTSQGKLSSTVGGIREVYNNYYDNRYVRLNLTYRFGSSKVSARQRNFGNETEKQRAY
jgi:Outer membrane protein beta-barrel family